MTLQDLYPLNKVEREMVFRSENEDEAVAAILKRRAFLRDNSEYIGSLCREQFRAKFAYHNEKETATMRILYEEDV